MMPGTRMSWRGSSCSPLLYTHFWVDSYSGDDISDLSPRGASIRLIDPRARLNENLSWVPLSLKEETDYRVYIPSLRSLRQRVSLNPGDALLLELASDGGFRFRRSMYAKLYKELKGPYARACAGTALRAGNAGRLAERTGPRSTEPPDHDDAGKEPEGQDPQRPDSRRPAALDRV